MSDYTGAFLLLSALPRAKELLGDKGYDRASQPNKLYLRGAEIGNLSVRQN